MRERETNSPLASLLLPPALVAVPVVLFWSLASLQGTLYYGDVLRIYYPLKAALDRSLADGELPLWISEVMGGYPLHSAGEGGFMYPVGLLLSSILPPLAALNYQLLLHLIIAGLGMYAFCRVMRLDAVSAAAGGLVFMLSGFLIAHLNHLSIVSAVAWLPVMFLLAELMTTRARAGAYAALLSLVVALQLTAGHAQMSFLSVLGVGLYVLFKAAGELVNGEGLSRAGILVTAYAVAVLLAAGVAAPQLLPTAELTSLSGRAGGLSGEFLTSFSLPPPYVLTFVLPFLLGDPLASLSPATSVEWCGYLGMLPLVAAAYACIFRRDHYTFFFAGLALVSLILAFGAWNPIYNALAQLPPFNLFRAPARFLLLYSFAVATLCALGLHSLRNPELPYPRTMPWALPGAIALFVVAAWGLTLNSARELTQLLTLWQFMPGFLVVLAVGLAVARGRIMMGRRAFTGLAVALLLVDLYAFVAVFGHTFNRALPPAEVAEPPHVMSLFRDESEPFRVYTHERITPATVGVRESLFPNYSVAVGQESLNGYLPLTLRGYQEYADRLLSAPRLADLANVGYLLIPQTLGTEAAIERENLANPLSPSPVGRRVEVPGAHTLSLEVESFVSQAADLPNGEVVGEVIVGEGHWSRAFPLRVGVETGEWAYDRPDVRDQIRHSRATVAREWPAFTGYPREEHVGYTYSARLSLERETPLTWVEIRDTHPRAVLHVDRVVLVSRAGERATLASFEGRGDYELAYRSHEVAAYRNVDALPRYYVVPEARRVPDAAAAWARLTAADFDPTAEVVLGPTEAPGMLERMLSLYPRGGTAEAQGGVAAGAVSEGVAVVERSQQRVMLRVGLAEPGYLVVADSYYPGWQAYVDGARVEVLRANWLFRAIELPPGEHEVEWRYDPPLLGVAWVLALLSVVGLGVVGLTPVFSSSEAPAAWRAR